MDADCEDRIWNSIVPRNVRRAGNVGSGIDVPVSTCVLPNGGGITPRGIRDNVAVFAEERFDHVQNTAVRDCGVAARAAIEHFVTKLIPANGFFPCASDIWGKVVKYT